ncbi:MAG: FecR domain-containing protein [Sphingobacterium sp.]|jgi:ferric-dicitrate binding protein FerR (iron transport regulator)|nr:FecR domain-containing protein [Sphingobacterium sp.]
MRQVKEIYRLIIHFLSRSENIEERKQLFDWFDHQSTNKIPKEHFSLIQTNAKKRLLNRITTREKKSGTIKYLRYSSTAAAILLISFCTYKYWPKTERIASEKILSSISSAGKNAIITLADGKQINLDQLPLNQRVQIGEIILQKDSLGKVSYLNASNNKPTVQKNSMHTPKGATYDLMLADGTLVTLNADSKLTYPTSFDDGNREVELEGEAYFHVQKTSNKSKFIVRTKSQRIEVLGTQFNVNAYTDNGKTQTSLEAGSVLVSLEPNPKYSIRLKPNEQAVLQNGEFRMHKINIDEVLSWKNGLFYFDGNNTAEVLQQIARWYNITITYKANNNKEQYTGKIPRNLSLNRLIELLNYADLTTKAILDKDNRINLIIT